MSTFVFRVQVDVPDDMPPRVAERLRDPERLRHLVAACLESEVELPWGLRVGLANVTHVEPQTALQAAHEAALVPVGHPDNRLTAFTNPSGCIGGL